MDEGALIAVAFLVAVALIGGAIYYSIRWYKGLVWWLVLLAVPAASTVLMFMSAQDKQGWDGLAAALPAMMVGMPLTAGGLLGGLIAGWRKGRRDD